MSQTKSYEHNQNKKKGKNNEMIYFHMEKRRNVLRGQNDDGNQFICDNIIFRRIFILLFQSILYFPSKKQSSNVVSIVNCITVVYLSMTLSLNDQVRNREKEFVITI